jgi:hypothetical protein
MKFTALVLLALTTSSLYAIDEFTTGIHSISSADANGQSIVRFTNGRVAVVDEVTAKDLQARQDDQVVQKFKARLGENSELLGLEEVTTLKIQERPTPKVRASYEPTILESEDKALRIMKHFRNPRPVQWTLECFNMAQVRAYEAFKNEGLKSMKMFIFFTDRYLREYRYKWWFHVTPMAYVRGPNGAEERVLDPEWFDRPVGTKTWTEAFMKNKATCPKIDHYSSYDKHQEENYCYLFPVPMYYFIPDDLMEMESSGANRSEFVMGEYYSARHDDF